jgi:hypothetical protein
MDNIRVSACKMSDCLVMNELESFHRTYIEIVQFNGLLRFCARACSGLMQDDVEISLTYTKIC